MILADTLRDRIDDVIADMERQFVTLAPTLESLIGEVLTGSTSAYAELQSVGRQALAPMIDRYGLASSALAAEWYDLNRDLAKIVGPWSGAVVQDPDINTGPLIGGSVKDFTTVESIASGIQAGMASRITQAANGTIMDSTLRDPRARGWFRSASAGCCPYCAMLAQRGRVYRTQNTATFSPHLHCKCGAAPDWGAASVGMRSREDTIATRRSGSDPNDPRGKRIRAQQNARAREWIEQNRGSLGLL